MVDKRLMHWILRLGFAGSLLCGAGCHSKPGTSDSKPSEPPAKEASKGKPVLVEIARVTSGNIEEILERSAPLEAEVQVSVLARTQNPAIELLVEEGDRVEKGQVLLRLESDRQQTDYDQAMSHQEKSKIEFNRQERLYQQHLISEAEYQDAKFTYNQAQLQVDNARRQLEYTEVRAPIQGTITRRMVKVGDQVGTSTPIFEIVDLESTVAMIHVPEQYLPKLKPNKEARLISNTYEGQRFTGFIKRTSPVVEARAGTVKVVVGVRELGDLRPGMWVDVELILDTQPDATLIPKRSIVYDNDRTYAFRIETDAEGFRRAKQFQVIPKRQDKENIEPMDGVKLGDLIVVAGQVGLKDGSLIRLLEEDFPSDTGKKPEVTVKTD